MSELDGFWNFFFKGTKLSDAFIEGLTWSYEKERMAKLIAQKKNEETTIEFNKILEGLI